MKAENFKNFVYELFVFFRYKERPGDKIIELWYKKVDYINDTALDFIIEKIEELDNLPRNLPKIIRSIYSQYTRENPNAFFIKYDQVEDMRYPVEKLYRGQEIYIKSGRGVFMQFCKTNYMPTMDIERVDNKVKHMIDIGKVEGFIDSVANDYDFSRRLIDEKK